MADYLQLNANTTTGAKLATDTLTYEGETCEMEVCKLAFGALNSYTIVDASNPFPVTAATLPLPTGAATSALQTTGNTSLSTIAGDTTSLDTKTVQQTLGGGAEAAAVLVTIANDSTGLLSVDDGGGSLTVDGTVAVSGTVTVDSELTTADLDTGAGTDTRAVVGLVGSASGGGELIPGTAASGLLVDLGANNDVTVTGTVTANLGTIADVATETTLGTVAGDTTSLDTKAVQQTLGGGLEASALLVTLASDSTGLLSVDDNGGSLTVDNATLSVVGGGAEATALRVTLASDSTGVLSVDDNGTTLSVDDGSGSLTIDNSTLAVVGGGTQATALRVTIANDSTGVLSVDDNGGSLTIDNTSLSVMAGWDNAASDGASVSGDVAHDAVDAGEPVKIGAKTRDYQPVTSGEESGGLTETAEGDRANISANLRGEIIEGVNGYFFTLDNVSTTYDGTTTTATSTAKECWNYRWCSISFDLVSGSTPTDIQFDVEVSLNGGSNYAKLYNGPLGLWVYDDTSCATEISVALSFPIAATHVRLKVTATGTTGSGMAGNYFDVNNAVLYLRN